MERLACVDIPALPLQLVQARLPEWKDAPAAIVERDAPQGLVLSANERARRAGVLPGQRFATALTLCATLRACAVAAAEVDAGVTELAALAITTVLLRRLPRYERPHRLDIIGAILIVLAIVLYKVLSWEAARYDAVLRYLATYGR